MRFSIIVPVYNVEKYLEECVMSVLQQDFKDFEILLIDDGSTDNSGVICDSLQTKYSDIIHVFHKNNEGLFATRWYGFDKANGDYCISLDSDDFLSKGALRTISNNIERFSPDFLLYDLYMYNDGLSLNINDTEVLEPEKIYTATDILKDHLISGSYNSWSMCAKCIKASLLKSLPPLSEYYHISYGEDSLQSIYIYNYANNFVYIKGCLYNYRQGSGMMKKLSPKYLDDFFCVANIMESECKLLMRNYKDKIENYKFNIFQYYLRNVCASSASFKEFKSRCKKAEQIFASNREEFSKYKMDRKNVFIMNKMYFSVYLFLLLKKMEKKYVRN